jgi:hypothetical protein
MDLSGKSGIEELKRLGRPAYPQRLYDGDATGIHRWAALRRRSFR